MSAALQLQDEAWDLRNKKGNLTGALEKVNQALQDKEDIDVLLKKSIIERDNGKTEAARQTLQHILASTHNELATIEALRLLGFLELLQGSIDAAYAQATKAHELALKVKRDKSLSNTCALLGNIEQAKGSLKAARDYYNDGLEYAKAAKYTERELTLRINLATIEAELGNTSDAEAELDELLERTKNRWHKAYYNVLFEKIRLQRQKHSVTEDALDELGDAYKAAASQGWADEQGNLAYELALLHRDQEQYASARGYYEKALEIFTKAKILGKVAKIEAELDTLPPTG